MRARFIGLLAASLFIATFSQVSVAEAQRVDIRTPHRGSRPMQLDFHGGFAWHGVGVATGVRFGIPILENGFIPSINNAFYINFGADFYWLRWRQNRRGDWDYSAALGMPVTAHWEFYFNPQWSAFVELGFQIFFHPNFFNGASYDVHGEHWFVGAVGGSFHISDSFLITLRVGNPYVAAGITLQF